MSQNFLGPGPQQQEFNALQASSSAQQDGLAIVSNGNTHAAIASGQFVYVKNHSSLAEGLYKAKSAISANGALSTSNLTADGSGGLNDLQSQVDTLNSNIVNVNETTSVDIPVDSWIPDPFDLPIPTNRTIYNVYDSQSGNMGMIIKRRAGDIDSSMQIKSGHSVFISGINS